MYGLTSELNRLDIQNRIFQYSKFINRQREFKYSKSHPEKKIRVLIILRKDFKLSMHIYKFFEKMFSNSFRKKGLTTKIEY